MTFADEHGLSMISIERPDPLPPPARDATSQRVAETRLPTAYGDFTAYGYRITVDGVGAPRARARRPRVAGDEPVLTRVHSECLTGDVFGSQRCDCGPQLEEALERIVAEGRGVVVYLRGHEGRGIGLVAKLQAYQLQDGGRDTVDANLDLGLPADARHYGAATQILRDLGVGSVRLLTNNPDKVTSLEAYGIAVAERVPLTPAAQRPQPRLPADQARPDGPRPARTCRRDPAPPSTATKETRVSGDGAPDGSSPSTATTCGSRWSRPAGTSR